MVIAHSLRTLNLGGRIAIIFGAGPGTEAKLDIGLSLVQARCGRVLWRIKRWQRALSSAKCCHMSQLAKSRFRSQRPTRLPKRPRPTMHSRLQGNSHPWLFSLNDDAVTI